MISLLVLAVLGAADGGTPTLEPLAAPLGEIGDVVTEVPPEGVPGSERVVVVTLPGCSKPQAIWLTRFILGSAIAGRQVNDWLVRQPKLQRSLFGKSTPLVQAVQRARRTTPRAGACAAAASWQLGAEELGARSCKEPLAAVPGDHLFEEKGKVAQVVRLTAADASTKDRCRPRLSVLLGDDKGVARLAVHADYAGVMTAELFGVRCERVTFTFDEGAKVFVATPSKRPNCPAKGR